MSEEAAHHRGRLKNKIMVMAILALLTAQGMMVTLVYYMGVQGAEEARADLLRVWIDKSQDITTGFAYTVEQATPLTNITHVQAVVDGFIRAHPDVELLKVYTADPANPSTFVTSASSNRSLIGDPADAGDVAAITSNKSTYQVGPSEEPGKNERILEVVAPIHDATGKAAASASLTWSLATVDKDVGNLQRTFITNLLLGAISLLGVSVLVFVIIFNEVTGRITGPLATLKSAAEAISMGNFDAPIDASSGDEIADLAESFKRMAASLKLAARLKTPVEADARGR